MAAKTLPSSPTLPENSSSPIRALPLNSVPQPPALPSPLMVLPSAPMALSQVISEKLDDRNFLIWKQQIVPILKGHRLHSYLVSLTIPPKFLTESDRDAAQVNLIYSAWEQQDQLLLFWLQSTLSIPILARMIGCVHSWQLWEKLHTYFRARTKAKGIQLRIELCNTKKGTRSISEYLYCIKAIVDSLYSIGDAVSPHEQSLVSFSMVYLASMNQSLLLLRVDLSHIRLMKLKLYRWLVKFA